MIRDIGYDDPEIGFDHNSCAVLTSIGLSEADQAKIFHQNAVKLFGLKV